MNKTPGSWLIGQTDEWTLTLKVDHLRFIHIVCFNKKDSQEMMDKFLKAIKEGPEAAKQAIKEVEERIFSKDMHNWTPTGVQGVFRQRCLHEKVNMRGMSYESQAPPR